MLQGVVYQDAQGRVVSMNPAAERILGKSSAELLHRPCVSVEHRAIREDGSPFPDLEHPSNVALRTGREQHGVVMGVFNPHENGYRWISISAVPLFHRGEAKPYRVYTLFDDVTERKKMEDELRAADRRKDEFLGVLSHELRNPLAPIRNSVHVLNHADPAGAQARRAVAVIGRQVEQLTRLIEDLLEVKRLSAGKLRLRAKVLDLAQAVRDAVEDLRPLFATRGLALHLQEPAERVWVVGDAVRLSQVLGNLLQNALKFTDPGGRVGVFVERRQHEARIRIRDDGVGVAPELLDKLFDPFVQGENTADRGAGGLGLGLAVVRGVVELHGGTVVARSEGAGKGSEFVVALPAVEPPLPAAGIHAISQPGTTSRRRIVIIDEDEDAALSLRDVLELDASCEVHVARDGPSGVAAARRLRPDVIVCDLPPHEDGRIAAQLRAAVEGKGATLVALSGYASPGDAAHALQAGFDRHLSKPPDLNELARIVAAAPRSGSPMMDLPPELVTGHRELDSQHAAILAELQRMRASGALALKASLASLQQHTASHFAYEELLMEDVGFPERASHKQAHSDLIARLLALRCRIERAEPTGEAVGAVLDEVEGWVVDHELRQDVPLVEFVRAEHAPA
jgi:hemerythrin-like metal-binding protein/PAS domain S-box-containing protein